MHVALLVLTRINLFTFTNIIVLLVFIAFQCLISYVMWEFENLHSFLGKSTSFGNGTKLGMYSGSVRTIWFQVT